ncbi:hypothetical protein DL93DRAFT_2089807 [Clavulina sp. PMI_390]|nr:hypothetical protein DL93DRAFT_2089807 [Clavulina sp. PMI_390]
MQVDAQKLENLRAWEKQRQERQEREERKEKERQERHAARERERERQKRQQYSHSSQHHQHPYDSDYRRARATNAGHGYHTDNGSRRPHLERKGPYSRTDKRDGMSEEMVLMKAWASYQLRWAGLLEISTPEAPLTYASIPWPVASDPCHPTSLTPQRMAVFLLSSLHSPDKPAMERIREAMKLWHPDKFEGRFMALIAPSDRAIVREGLGMVARGLIDLMRLQKKVPG